MDEGSAALLKRAVARWSKAQVVYEGPTRAGIPEPLLLVDEVAARPDCHDALLSLLSSQNQLVVAYVLLTLRRMGSAALAELPKGLLERREKITLDCGSFRNSMDLGGLARQFRKEATGLRNPAGRAEESPHQDMWKR